MELTHNKINNAISFIEGVVAKGQPFAKRNKERRIRAALGWMRKEQEDPITLAEVWFYFVRWLKYRILSRK